MRDFLRLAIESDIYTDYSENQWEDLLTEYISKDHVETAYKNGELIGYVLWYRTNDPTQERNVYNGEFLYIPFIFIKPEYRKNGVIRNLGRKVLNKNKDVKNICWNDMKRDEIIKIHRLRRNHG